ncbi:hypothetical protein TWF696_002456 [Orbilia brochopaga]|uniref:Uncharacterized protein n=1 Tax=Orbilia brochopaga TaxID=3140254 RepID=A0AAV9U4T5_9PEZI
MARSVLTIEEIEQIYTYSPPHILTKINGRSPQTLVCKVTNNDEESLQPYNIDIDAIPVHEGSLTVLPIDMQILADMSHWNRYAIQQIIGTLDAVHDTSATGRRQHWVLTDVKYCHNDHDVFLIVVRPIWSDSMVVA